VGEPVAATDKIRELPALIVIPLGSRVITGATTGSEIRYKTAEELVSVPVGDDTVTEYVPKSDALMEARASVALVAPAILTPSLRH
jgi:hypothetical protein